MQPADLMLNGPLMVRGIKYILSYQNQMQANNEHKGVEADVLESCMEHFLRL
jgi:hypothetical protein